VGAQIERSNFETGLGDGVPRGAVTELPRRPWWRVDFQDELVRDGVELAWPQIKGHR
jgi:hypothetical protein